MRTLVCLMVVLFGSFVCENIFAQKLTDVWIEGKSYVGTDAKFRLPEGEKLFDPLRPHATVGEKSIFFENRGIARTKNPVAKKKPVTLEFTVIFLEGQEGERYHDSFAVVLHTSGNQREAWPHEISDGIAVKLMAHQNRIVIHHYKPGVFTPDLVNDAGGIVFKRYQPYKLKIVDDGNHNLKVFVDEKEMINAKIPETEGDQIALYDREPVAGVRKTLIVMYVSLTIGG